MPLFQPPGKRRDSPPVRRAGWKMGVMTLQPATVGQPGEEDATHRRVPDGALFRPGPTGRAETFLGGSWVPAGWENSDLKKLTVHALWCVERTSSRGG